MIFILHDTREKNYRIDICDNFQPLQVLDIAMQEKRRGRMRDPV